MADSLVIANTIELLGGTGAGTKSLIPACYGATFRLQSGYDLSAPQPTTDFVASLLLDGERPYGRRSSNRTIKLPVAIFAPDRKTLAAAREVLEQAIDADQWTMTWTRDPGTGTPLPLLLDCFRAQATTPLYDIKADRQLVHLLTLTIPARPYGRSDVQTQVAFAAPVPVGPPPPPAPVTLDTFSSISSSVHYSSPRCIIGPQSLAWDPDSFGDPGGQVSQFSYSAQLGQTANLTGLTSLALYLGFGSRYYTFLEYHGNTAGVTVAATLTDSSGNTLSFSRSGMRLPVAQVWSSPTFSRVTMPIPQGQAGFNYAAVVSYSLTITNRLRPSRLSWVTTYVDNLVANPPSVTANPVTRGAVFTIQGVHGTARAPLSMTFQQPAVAGTPTTITAAGIGNYTVPANTSYLKVEAIGAGGPGATMPPAGVGGGGSGAEYGSEPVFPATAGQVIPYSVAAASTPGNDGGSTTFGPGPASPLVVIAGGGLHAAQNSITGGQPNPVSTNQIHNPGGAGRTASGAVGGGGGSSGGSASAGLAPTGTAATVFTAAGTTPWVCPNGVTQVFAETWGAGASGATGSTSLQGGAGGGGEYAAAYIPVTAGLSYSVVVGAAGAAVSGSAVNGNNGGNSQFTGDGGQTVLGHGGLHGSPGFSGGQGSGGTGSTAAVHYPGGTGGPAYPYSGGGGSSAGTSAAGNNGDGYGNPGSAPTGGGKGGSGTGATNNNGVAGVAPGGGGGGTYNPTTSGAGAAGQVRLTFPGGSPTNNGAAAVTGGGAGGQGGGTAGTPGTAGAQPGGGGGGADSSGSTVAGGNGGAGQLKITPYAPPAFKSLIAHRPPLGSPKTLSPLVSVGAGGDVPNGTIEYTMPQPVAGVNADFGGTYTVYLIASSWSGGAASGTTRNITVTVKQYEYSGGPSYPASTVTITIAPNQVTNGIVTAGVLTLPVKAVAADNTQGYYTVTVTDSQTADRFYDCLFLDTMGQTLVCNLAASGYVTYWADAPDNADLGFLLGSQTDRTAAISVLDQAEPSGGTLHLEPSEGDNQLFVYSADAAAPNVALSYFATWFFDRTA